MPATDPTLGEALLSQARSAIADALGSGAPPAIEHADLAQRGACFVTLTKAGQLRGCIGSLRPQHSLRDDVRHNAVAAATRDPRFPALDADEFTQVSIEVSRLGESHFLDPCTEAEACATLKPGVDGVILFRGCREVATFLPQVWAQLPSPADFLHALKRKGGLPEDYWGHDLMLATYAVDTWSEAPRGTP